MERLGPFTFRLSTGRMIHAENGVIGLNEGGECGHDGYEYEKNGAWTPEEKTELADFLIEQCQVFKQAVNVERCKNEGHEWSDWLGMSTITHPAQYSRLRRCHRCGEEEVQTVKTVRN